MGGRDRNSCLDYIRMAVLKPSTIVLSKFPMLEVVVSVRYKSGRDKELEDDTLVSVPWNRLETSSQSIGFLLAF